MNRRGFALVAVLWTITALSAVVGFALASTRLGALTTRNRILLARGRWAAEACLAIAQARWVQGRLADTTTIDLGRTTRCRWSLEDPTARLNINLAPKVVLAELLGDSIAQAVVDRRRTAPFADVAQLAGVPGFDTRARWLTVEGPGSVNANSAPPGVLAAIPGLGPEAVARLVSRRMLGRPIQNLDELAGELSSPARGILLGRYTDLARTLTFAAPQYRLTAHGWVAEQGARSTEQFGALTTTIELMVVPLPERLAAIRRRIW